MCLTETKDCAHNYVKLPSMHLPLQLAGPLLRCISLLPEFNVQKSLRICTLSLSSG